MKRWLKSAGLFAAIGFIFNFISDRIADSEDEEFREDIETRLKKLEEKNED